MILADHCFAGRMFLFQCLKVLCKFKITCNTYFLKDLSKVVNLFIKNIALEFFEN